MAVQSRFLRLPAVTDLTGIKRSAIYKRIAEGTFPRPIKLSERCSVWPEQEVLDWQEAQIQSSRSKA
jgi:prophage regulatory protein